MQRKKAIVDEKIAQAQEEHGMFLVTYRQWQGKSSSAFGMAARSLGHGLQIGHSGQFIQGRAQHRRETFFRTFPEQVRLITLMARLHLGKPRTARRYRQG